MLGFILIIINNDYYNDKFSSLYINYKFGYTKSQEKYSYFIGIKD